MDSHKIQVVPDQKKSSTRQHWSVDLSRWLCRSILFILRIQVFFKDDHIKNVRLICCNHVSWLDVVVLHAYTGCAFVAKKEVQAWPLVGLLGHYNGTLFVDRSSLAGRVRCLKALQKKASFPVVCIFPEGTTRRSLFPSQQDWKQGWIWSAKGQSVAVAALAFAKHNRIGWDDGESLLQNLVRVLCTPKKKCIIKTQLLEVPLTALKHDL